MTQMTVKEMHERLMLYKMVRQVVAKEKCGLSEAPWLCNMHGYQEESIDETLH